jgi:hypothetical protein
MNNKKGEHRNEALIREFAETSKGLKTSEGLRESNRRYIKDALYSVSAGKRKTPGWLKKRISIPFPVAAGFLVIFCLQLILQSFNLITYFKESKPTVSNKTDSIGLLEKPVQPHYSEHNVYVAGMGFVEKLKNYTYFKENNYENN